MSHTRLKLLFVEDDEANRKLFERLVQKQQLPYACTLAASVAAARERLNAEHFEVVIADYYLGDGTALDLFDLTAAQHTPVIVITAQGNEALAVQAIQAGAADYLIKDWGPYFLDLLPLAVKKAIQHHQAELALQQRATELTVLHDITLSMTAARDLPTLLQAVAERAPQLFGADMSGLYLCEPHTREVRLAAGHNLPAMHARRTLKYGEDAVGVIAESGEPLLIADYHQWPRRLTHIDANTYTSLIGAPLKWQTQTAGVLVIAHTTTGHQFTPAHVELLSLLANHAAIAVANVRLLEETQRLAVTDPLTGVYNRRYWFELGEIEVARARRYRRTLSAIMLDIDHFKRVNDTYGHAIGDQVLCAMTQHCAAQLRRMDVIGRYGGEEFAILLPETDQANARHVAERLCQSLAATRLLAQPHPLKITASLGVASLSEHHHDLLTLLDHADQALYAAKQAGRNRVMVSEMTH